jgi:hypothetical protein
MSNVDLMEWLLWYFGSCMTGYPAEMIVNFYGKSKSKHTLVNVMKKISSAYYTPLPRTILRNEQNSLTEINQMPSGIRFASLDLDSENVTLNTSELLNIMRTSIKPLILSEKKISLTDIDTNGKLTFCFVPFSEKNDKVDYSEDELFKEGPGILGIIIQYSQKYIQNGCKLPHCTEIEIVKV